MDKQQYEKPFYRLDWEIRKRERKLAKLNEWEGTKQDFVMEQLLKAIESVEFRHHVYECPHIEEGKSALRYAVNRRIDDLIEIARLYRLPKEKIAEWSETLKEQRKKLANELRSARKRLRKLESLESQRTRFLQTLNAVIRQNGFKPIPPPQFEANQLTRNGSTSPLPDKSAIYFLWEGPLVAYVGQSVRLPFRLTQNHNQLQRSDKISFICVARKDLFFHEAFYIGVCRPWRNGHII